MKLNYDVIIVGGSIGGVLSAYSLCRNQFNVLLIEETDWIGGQLTAQGVPNDEHPFIEETGCSATYRAFREQIRKYYRSNINLKSAYQNDPMINPGGGWVSRIGHEPKVSLKILNDMINPYITSGHLDICLNANVKHAHFDSKYVYHVDIDVDGQFYSAVEAKYFIDATDNGDLLPMTETAYRVGADAKSTFSEPHAPEKADPNDLQPITWVAAISYEAGGNHQIEKPKSYEFFKNHRMLFGESPLSWFAAGLDLHSKREFSMFGKTNDQVHIPALFTYRQIIDPNKYKDSKNIHPTTILNWPQNDYFFDNIIENDQSDFHKAQAKELTLSLVYWLQTEAKRDDGTGYGYQEIMLSKNTFDTEDGLAKAPYIRESRRIDALYTVKEQDIARKYAPKPPKFWDSVGVGMYHIDLHMTTKSHTYFYEPTWPFEIPLGAFIPKQKINLIPACKNIGTTHITNGCYRVHPIEWNIGESAGLLIAYALKNQMTPREIYQDKFEVAKFQTFLVDQGIMLYWPEHVYQD